MNLEEVKEWVKQIKEFSNDPEHAHGSEDDLHSLVLKQIARELLVDGGRHSYSHLGKMAEAAYNTRKIKFPRWCA